MPVVDSGNDKGVLKQIHKPRAQSYTDRMLHSIHTLQRHGGKCGQWKIHVEIVEPTAENWKSLGW